MTEAVSYDAELGYLLRYAAEDWVMALVVVESAGAVRGGGAPAAAVVETAARLAADLTRAGFPPGEVHERRFVPWPGTDTDRVERFRAGLAALADAGRLHEVDDLCWFSTPDVAREAFTP